MTEQPQPKTVSTALLERIAAATEANGQALQALVNETGAMRALLADTLAELARQAAQLPAAPAPTASGNGSGAGGGQYRDFMADTIVVTIGEDGKPAYKAKGEPFTKFGVRIWPETLGLLGLSADALKPGANQLTPPLAVRAVLNDEGHPKKITGKA